MPNDHIYSLDEVKSFSPTLLRTIISRLKLYLKRDDRVKKLYQQYGADINEIDTVPMKFNDIDVSAQTNHGIIYFSYRLLCDGDFFKDYGYAIHELTHNLQQTCSDGPTQGSDEGNYLDNPEEVEAFQNQVKWIDEELGKEEATEYVDQLLKHHDIKGKEKVEKAKELNEKVE